MDKGTVPEWIQLVIAVVVVLGTVGGAYASIYTKVALTMANVEDLQEEDLTAHKKLDKIVVALEKVHISLAVIEERMRK